MRTFHVFRKLGGKYVFWMNARGVSCKQVRHAVWYNNRHSTNKANGRVDRDDILVEDPERLTHNSPEGIDREVFNRSFPPVGDC